ncbi:MAG: hypothetical protein FWD17_08150, partial [Polyangiaceae bacterium]|nr:hypothetical protein [Polyangiaceae bacterium]
MTTRAPLRPACWIAAAVLTAACTRAPSEGAGKSASEAASDPLVPLLAWENDTRAKTDFAHAPASDGAFGPDPYAIRAIEPAGRARGGAAGALRYVGILRGRAAVVALDEKLTEVARLPAPDSPSGLATGRGGDVFVVGELTDQVARYRAVDGRIDAAAPIALPGVRAMRGVATGPEGVVYVVEEHDGRLVTFTPPGDGTRAVGRVDVPLCHAPVRVARVARSLLVDCLLDHVLVVRSVDDRGYPRSTESAREVRIVHDGPIWGFDAAPAGDAPDDIWVAMGGVEDHPLDRTQGSFGFVDSFAWLYRVRGGQAREVAEINLSERGVVTPKALGLAVREGSGPELVVAGYGSSSLATIDWADGEASAPPAIRTQPIAPGSAAITAGGAGTWVVANPLLDAWVRVGEGEGSASAGVVAVPDPGAAPRSNEVRLGEALFFTTLMAPWNQSEGRLSRFTCETCHFEGYTDGRTHYTGRADVYATTKPLLGLFNNRPHFSRAL